MTDRIDSMVEAFMAHQAMEDTRSYLERGRQFEGLSVEDLNARWAAAFTAVCAQGDQSQAIDLADFGAELGLRKLKHPEHLIGVDTMNATQRRMQESRRQMLGPMEEAVGRFRDKMDKPKN